MEFLIVVLIVVIVVILVRYFKSDNNLLKEIDKKDVCDSNYYLPYKIQETIMSAHERLLFENIRTTIGSDYDVYPQMKLDKIFKVEYQKIYKYYLGWLRKINQKSVDFLVVKRDTQSPIFAIELDDSSHEKEDRRERDKFVEEIFRRNNFPLIRFNPGQYKIEELKIVLEKYLNLG